MSFTWRLTQNDTVDITFYNGNDVNVVIPAEIDGRAVEHISSHAFKSTIESIVLPSTLKSVEHGAFSGCTALKSIKNYPVSRMFDVRFFDDLTALEELTLAENDKYIVSDGAVYTRNMKTLVYCFKGIVGKSYTLPREVEDISFRALYHTQSLEHIEVEEGNKCFKSVDGVLFSANGKMLERYPAGKLDKSYDIPRGVIKVGFLAFHDVSTLEKIYIPNTVKVLDRAVLGDCHSLTIYAEATRRLKYWDEHWNELRKRGIGFTGEHQRVEWHCKKTD